MTLTNDLHFAAVPEDVSAVVTNDGRVFVHLEGLIGGMTATFEPAHTEAARLDTEANHEDPQSAYTHGCADGALFILDLMANGLHEIQQDAFDSMPLADEPQV